MQKAFGWNDPDRLVDDFIEDMREASYGIAQFEIVERTVVDEFAIKADGFRYESDQFAKFWRRRRGFHEPAYEMVW